VPKGSPSSPDSCPPPPEGTAAVSAVAKYTDPDGAVSVVSSCDMSEFKAGRLAAITSYGIELPTA
jgi:hypothetical protein